MKDPTLDAFELAEHQEELQNLLGDLETRTCQMYEIDTILFGTGDIPKFEIR